MQKKESSAANVLQMRAANERVAMGASAAAANVSAAANET